MSVENFIPAIWSADVMRAFEGNLVFGGLVNRDYEGEIANFGDTVKINAIGAITVKDYVKNSTELNYETLQDSSQVLVIDQSKYIAFQVDDVDNAQTKPKLREAATYEAGLALAETMDGFVAGMYGDAMAPNKVGSDASAITIGYGASQIDAYKQFVNLGVKLSEQNVPETGRWIVVPPWLHGMLRKSPQFIANPAGVTGGGVANGRASATCLRVQFPKLADYLSTFLPLRR